MSRGSLPRVIQGGMGVAVSGWKLARAVSSAGQLGVVSGTALDVVLARRLQLGDPEGDLRRALDRFPVPGVADRILDRYFIAGGKPARQPFRNKPLASERLSRAAKELLVAANFVEVFLAREGHEAPVGINYLEKIQLETLPSLFGAMLAGVSMVLMGAGIPKAIPAILDRLSQGLSVELQLDISRPQGGDPIVSRFDPAEFCGGDAPALTRPDFIAIISTTPLATMLARKASGRVDGFVIEGPRAGGHNAPPRGRAPLSETGEPVYGERDIPDLEAIRALGLPFWLAGSSASPERLAEAIRQGAAGVQVGTAFAYSEESGFDPALKERVLEMSRSGQLRVFTDPVASPTGFPFKIVELEGTLSEPVVQRERIRRCDLGYLRHGYERPDGTIGWRCPGEPVDDYIAKGGDEKDTIGRQCICNGLLASIGLGQIDRSGVREPPLVTSGDDVTGVARFLPGEERTYRAANVIAALTSALGEQDPADSGEGSPRVSSE